jgi:hypothetical protein
MGWILLVMFLVAVFITLSFCKAASDADDESERLWEEYLHKLREIKDELEDKERIAELDEKEFRELDDERMEG